jgi:hypothetical protein
VRGEDARANLPDVRGIFGKQEVEWMKRKPKAETISDIDKQCLALWSDCIIARDRVCRVTGSEKSLSAHHIRSRGHASTRFDLENGMCLSWTKWHFLQKMAPERFQDGIIDAIGIEKYEQLRAKSRITLKRNIQDYRDERDRLKRELKALQSDYGFTDLPF